MVKLFLKKIKIKPRFSGLFVFIIILCYYICIYTNLNKGVFDIYTYYFKIKINDQQCDAVFCIQAKNSEEAKETAASDIVDMLRCFSVDAKYEIQFVKNNVLECFINRLTEIFINGYNGEISVICDEEAKEFAILQYVDDSTITIFSEKFSEFNSKEQKKAMSEIKTVSERFGFNFCSF